MSDDSDLSSSFTDEIGNIQILFYFSSFFLTSFWRWLSHPQNGAVELIGLPVPLWSCQFSTHRRSFHASDVWVISVHQLLL